MTEHPPSLIERHEIIKRRRRLLRVIGPLSIVVLLAINLTSLAGRANDLDQAAFSEALQSEAVAAWPRVKTRLESIRDEVGPDLEGAFGREMDRLNTEVGGLLEREEKKQRLLPEGRIWGGAHRN